jgi:hypothetical protein
MATDDGNGKNGNNKKWDKWRINERGLGNGERWNEEA